MKFLLRTMMSICLLIGGVLIYFQEVSAATPDLDYVSYYQNTPFYQSVNCVTKGTCAESGSSAFTVPISGYYSGVGRLSRYGGTMNVGVGQIWTTSPSYAHILNIGTWVYDGPPLNYEQEYYGSSVYLEAGQLVQFNYQVSQARDDTMYIYIVGPRYGQVRSGAVSLYETPLPDSANKVVLKLKHMIDDQDVYNIEYSFDNTTWHNGIITNNSPLNSQYDLLEVEMDTTMTTNGRKTIYVRTKGDSYTQAMTPITTTVLVNNNDDPVINLTNPSNDLILSNVEGRNTLELSGEIKDNNVGDNVIVKITIDGLSGYQNKELP
ncbi:hypothetical protein ACFSCX_05945 [Bacillus salitolerans]|uniref:Uncharacterized protein n=1 Tax=Bacillus salitolerans TaxID=1437434 RepID=A0ABW4LN33_9BACI